MIVAKIDKDHDYEESDGIPSKVGNVKYQEAFKKWANSRMDTWEGPDGFGLVRKIEVLK